MISVVVCSINSELLRNLKKNISETIGVEYEMIAFDNTKESFGICKVYNLCAERAKYDYLCFVHEDVVFQSKDWGKRLIDTAPADFGVVGLAGGRVKTSYPTSWGDAGKSHSRINVYQQLTANKLRHDYSNPNREDFSEVIVLDGVFLFAKREVWDNNRFDEATFSHFHLYDQDFSFNISNTHQNYVCNTIQLLHLSRGHFDAKWLDETCKFSEKWKNQLPKSVELLSSEEWAKANHRALYALIKSYLIKTKAPNALIKSYLDEFETKFPKSHKRRKLKWKFFLKRVFG
jgi:glycosyltransferase involved in cell wall biosynthesis